MTDRWMDGTDNNIYSTFFCQKERIQLLLLFNSLNLNNGHGHGLWTVLRPLPGIVCFVSMAECGSAHEILELIPPLRNIS